MRSPSTVTVLALYVILFLPTTGYAQTQVSPQGLSAQVADISSQYSAPPSASESDPVSVIVKLKDASVASYRGGVDGLDACSIEATGGNRLDLGTAACVAYLAYMESKIDELAAALSPEARIVHRLPIVLGGASVILPEAEVLQLAKLPNVEAVFEDGTAQLETVDSPEFIGAVRLWEELGGSAQAGEGIIVGVIDSGVWPESPSFSDPDPSGIHYPPPPARWKGTACDFGSAIPGDEPFTCNNKLIGAQRIMDTHDEEEISLPTEFISARDDNGHGTHILSTAAGNSGAQAAVVFGQPLAVISGIAPRAHVVAYKVSGATSTKFSDVTAAIQQAVADGVDVINYSMSSPDSSPYANAVSLAFLDAYEAGIVVATSAGNNGPEANTITSREPWAIVVGNSTGDNIMAGTLEVTAANGDTLTVSGTSVTGSTTGPIVLAPEDNADCIDPIPEGTYTQNEIVICIRGGQIIEKKSANVAAAGGSGVVMYNFDGDDYKQDKHFLPFIHIGVEAGTDLLDFMASHDQPSAVLTQGEATRMADFPAGLPTLNPGTAPGTDVMNDGSSRGGSLQVLGISKPDITAPGTAILAGGTPITSTIAAASQGAPGLYMFASGTSMSSPHIAGSAALLMDLYPDWTPGDVKSALMTTALQTLVKEDGTTPAGPFDRGSGRVDLNEAFSPGLTFVGPTALDYLQLKDNLWNLNYPSLYVPFNPGRITVERTVANQLRGGQQWKTHVSAPPDVEIVVPKRITLPNDGVKTFDITVDGHAVPTGEVRHANLRLTNGDHEANFPITFVKRDSGNQGLPLAKSCEPTTFQHGETTECTITVTNTTFDDVAVRIDDRLPRQLRLRGDVDGATRHGAHELTFEGVLQGVVSPLTVQEGQSPFGYLPLASMGVMPIADVSDESITNFTVPEFVYGGEIYTEIGLVSNGYAVVGGGDALDVRFLPKTLPNTDRPNNVIAPFWTDLAGSESGNFYQAIVTDDNTGIDWIVLEWEDVSDFSESNAYSFQIWIESQTGEQGIFMVYGRVDGEGNEKGLHVGAENADGTLGQTWPALPEVGTELAVIYGQGAPGETHTITFTAKGVKGGSWENCAEMTSPAFIGTAMACAEGEVLGPPGKKW